MRGILSEDDHSRANAAAAPDTAEAMDGRRERVELNSRGYRGPLGALARQPNDGPLFQEDGKPRPSGKAAADWVAMRRAKTGTLMCGAIENKLAEIVLQRGRELHDAATSDVSALPPLYTRNFTKSARTKGDAVHSDDKAIFRIDFTTSDLNSEDEATSGIPYQMDFRHRFGPPGAPRERRIASWSDEQARVMLSRVRTLQDERRDVPRGPDEKRSPKQWRADSLRWAGKVKCKGGPPSFSPSTEQTQQQARLEAIYVLELFNGLMSQAEYQDFIMILANTVSMEDVGIQAGFAGKQAEAVGLDRSRTAISAAVQAFEIIDGLTDVDWLEKVPDATRLPAWLVQSAKARERRRQAGRRVNR